MDTMDTLLVVVQPLVDFLKPFPLYKQRGWTLGKEVIPYMAFTFIFSTFIFLLEFWLDNRQKSNYKKGGVIPDGVTKEIFEKSLVYNYEKIAFDLVCKSFDFVLNMFILLSGAMPLIWDYSAATVNYLDAQLSIGLVSGIWMECFTTTFFVTYYTLFSTIMSLPWSYYKTFIIEERHGFNKSTVQLFVQDKVISLALTLVIGTPVTGVIIYLFRTCGEDFPLYVWFFLFAFSLFMMAVYPTLIAPLYNKFTPLEDGPLKVEIEALAKKVGFPLSKLFTMDGSKRSGHSNAFFYGLWEKMIVLYDTLITQCTQNELVAILGHEIGHWKLWHTWQGFIISQIYTFALVKTFTFVQGNSGLYSAFGFTFTGVESTPVFIGMMLFVQTYWSPVESILSFFMNMNSRYNEFQADKYSKDLGYAEDLAKGLIKLNIENLGNMVPDPYYSTYYFSHPPVVERIKALGIESAKKKET
jgi:STE24 endopeptidase